MYSRYKKVIYTAEHDASNKPSHSVIDEPLHVGFLLPSGPQC